MRGVAFAHEVLQWIALGSVVVLAVAYSLDFTRRRYALGRVGHLPMLARMMPTVSVERRIAKAIFLVTGVALALGALARPQTKDKAEWKERGIDVVVVMDYSKSMMAKDVYPSRIEATARATDVLLDSLASDRVAVVAFAGAAAHFPLTADTAAARLLYDGLTPLEMPPGSDIGEAILRARCIVRPDKLDEPGCQLADRGRGGAPLRGVGAGSRELPTDRAGIDRARAIVVFTDGEDTEDRVRGEVQKAVDWDIEVFFMGVGTTSGELIPDYADDSSGPLVQRKIAGYKKTPDGQSFITTRLVEGALLELARAAGGEDRYFRLTKDGSGMAGLLDRLAKLEKGDLDDRVVEIPKEVFEWLLFPAFLFLLIEACVSERRRKAVPRD